MTLDELWQAALGDIELTISRASFATWFKNSHLLEKRTDGTVVLSCHNNFAKEWLQNKYHKAILRSLRNLDADVKAVEYVVSSDEGKISRRRQEPKIVVAMGNQLDLPDFNIDRDTNLNPKYTFANFIVGSANELAHAAALAVVQDVGTKYNPLFIYGGVGLGKTHLLQAIGNEFHAKYGSKKKTRYVTSEKFTDELVNAIGKHSLDEFKNKFRHLDLLLIDDIQFVSGKEKTQEELFHTFNTLYEKNRQIVFTSDRPPKAIPSIEERLRSRFEGGMIVDIGYPDFETRMAILQSKMRSADIQIDEKILEFIATKISKNIRELEGALNRIIAQTKLKNRAPTTAEIDSLLAEILQRFTKVITAKQVIKAVADFYDIEEDDLVKKSRKKEVVRPRQIAMYLLREELKTSYPAIGEKLGGRDHTTAIHACDKIRQEIATTPKLAQEVNMIREKIFTT